MKARTTRRARAAVSITAVCVVVALGYEYLDTGGVSLIGVSVGILLGLPLSLLEGSAFAEKLRILPFAAALLAKTLTYLGIVTVVFLAGSLGFGAIRGLSIREFYEELISPDMFFQILTGFVLYLTIIFFRQLDRLLGPGILLRYVTGRYHRPRRERRVFMFLDLKSSTQLAERLGHEAYFALVNEFFRDLSQPVLDTDGEIYEYVGDEVVLTWEYAAARRDANCLRLFFAVDEIVRSKREQYLQRFGVVPEYKAGLHCGEVITAEIGDLKKEIVYNGDVLNTAARIQAECNRLGRRLVASRDLSRDLVLPAGYVAEPLGAVALRGKSDPLELEAFA